MRRGSVVGPLILILIGVVFLLNNLRPELSVIRLTADYWPYLLILWGSLRLIEVAIGAARGRPLPAQGVGGGEWALVVFLTLFGTGVFTFHNRIGPFPARAIRAKILGDFGESFDYTLVEKKVASSKAPRVIVENLRGNTRIVGIEGITEVKVSGRKTVRAMQQSDADKANEESPLDVLNQNDLIVIRTNQERVSVDRRVSADLEISVPKGATIQCRGRYGDFDISEIDGSIEITSENAGVRVQHIAGDVRVDLRRSDIIRAMDVKGAVDLKGRGEAVELDNVQGQVTVSGAYSGELHFRNLAKPLRYSGETTQIRMEAIPGELRLARGFLTGSRITGPVSVSARNKDIQMTEFTESLDIRIERGDIELHPGHLPLARIEAHANTGDIDLSLPENAKFELRAQVEKGEISNLYGPALTSIEEGRGGTLQGKVGAGPTIVLNTERGLIQVRKGNEMPALQPPGGREPPLPPPHPKIPVLKN